MGNTLLYWYLEYIDTRDQPSMVHLMGEIRELRDERLGVGWLRELGDVVHTALRMVHPMLGIIVVPVARKLGYRMRYGK